MTTTDKHSKWNDATQRLIDKTDSGELTWVSNHELCQRRADESEFIGPAYLTEFGGKQIAVYEYRYKNYIDADEWFWDTGVSIEFVNSELETEWRWPSPTGRMMLLDSIRYKTANADTFLHQLLTDHPAQ